MNLSTMLDEAFDGSWSALIKDWSGAGLDGMAGIFLRHANLFAKVDGEVGKDRYDSVLYFTVPPEQEMLASKPYMSKAEKFIHEVTGDMGWKLVVYVGHALLNDQPSKSYDWYMMPLKKAEYRYEYGR